MKLNHQIIAFNRGVVSPLALARVDIDRILLSAEEQTNWMPRVLGSMMLRPGFEYIGATRSNNRSITIPFIFSTDDLARIELTDQHMRVWVDDALVTRVSVSSAVTNGGFDANVTNWTDNDEVGGTSAWATGGYLSLLGNGTAAARRTQQITVSASDQNKEHALRIVIQRGPVTLSVGTTSGGDEYISATLGTGTHSLSFTPTGNFYIDFSSRLSYPVLVDSVAVESSGVMDIPAPWLEADLPYVRYDQSADVIFIACDGYQQYKIERRSTTSWSLVKYETEDGPFGLINLTEITISSSALTGEVTLTASSPLFKSTNVGSLYRIESAGQVVSSSITTDDTYTNSIRVTGVGSSRTFNISIAGTWTATVRLQQSTDNISWDNVTSYTANISSSYTDGLDNQIIYYRIGISIGEYTSGTVVTGLTYSSGSITGVARVTAYTSSTQVTAVVLADLGGTSGSTDWYESLWSPRRGYPTCVAFYEGRLWWAGRSKIWGSVSDAFSSFDETIEGDSKAINRSIGSGPVDNINWLVPVSRLLFGTEGSEPAARSNTLDEPLSYINFNIKDISTQGSARIAAIKVDKKALFVQRSGLRIYELAYDGNANDYSPTDLTILSPEICSPGISRLAVQRQPDTRTHAVLTDGTVALLVYDPAENTNCWIKIETDGIIEDAIILPGTTEDQVYYTIKRTINGSTVRYHEKMALESECQGGLLNKQADSFKIYDGVSTTSITGLSHLEGEEVVVWADGKDVGTKTVSGGAITLSTAAEKVVIGLSYTADYKSTKLAYGAVNGTALNQVKIIDRLGVILRNTHYQGLQYGIDFDNLDDMPHVEEGLVTPADTVWESYDKDAFEFDGSYSTDARLCLRAQAPRPCTLLGATIGILTNEKN